MHVRLPHLERQPLVECGSHRHLVDESAVDAGDRHDPAFAAAMDRLPQRARPVRRHERHRLGLVVPVVEAGAVGFHADRIDAGVRSDSAGHVLDAVKDVVFQRIEDLRAGVGRHPQPLRDRIDGDHPAGAQHERAPDGELTDRAAAPHRYRLAVLDLAVLGRHVSRREDVGHEEDLFVREMCGHLERADVGVRHARVLRLTAGVPAHHVRVAEQAGRREAVQLLRHRGIGIGVVAARPQIVRAEEAAPAGDRKRHDDPVTLRQVADPASDVHHLAHELVAQNVARPHRRNEAVEQVKVRPADRTRRDLDDRVAWVLDRWIGHVLDADDVGAFPADGFHGRRSPR